jgi:hypothetical protein
MIENNNHEPELLAVLAAIVIAMFGGAARELSSFETCFNKKRFFSNVIVSGFAGLLVGLAAPEFEHKNFVFIAAGISGTLGISIINYAGELFKAILKHLASQAIGHQIEVKDKDTKIN